MYEITNARKLTEKFSKTASSKLVSGKQMHKVLAYLYWFGKIEDAFNELTGIEAIESIQNYGAYEHMINACLSSWSKCIVFAFLRKEGYYGAF